MQLVWVLCLFVALTQTQPPPKNLDYTAFLSGVNKQLNGLAKRPVLLSGGSKDRQTLKEAQNVAASAKKLFAKTHKKLSVHIGEATAKDGGRLQIIVEKLSDLSKKVNADNLSDDEKKLLNHVVSQGIQHEATKAMSKLQGKLMNTLSNENAPAAAKLLLSQVMAKQLKDTTQKQAQKLTNTIINDKDDGVELYKNAYDDGLELYKNGGGNRGAYQTGFTPSPERIKELAEQRAKYEAEQAAAAGNGGTGVDDDEAVADTSSGLQGVNEGGGEKKKLCVFQPTREYCVSQEKAL